MKLLRAHVQNFKLLEDVEFEFSTDPNRPLTVIRAENGSGKTSLLYALGWGFFGDRGLPEEAQGLRLVSSSNPPGVAVTVQVTIEFEDFSESYGVTKYRLLRTAVETPQTNGDKVTKGSQSVRLVRLTNAGDEETDPALIERLLPHRLKDVFFTNGEDVQTFIAGVGVADQQQRHVRDAIRALLGLDALEITIADIDAVVKKFRAEAAKSAGADVEKSEAAFASAETELQRLQTSHEQVSTRLLGMREEKVKWDKELFTIKGIGDLDKLNEEVKGLEKDIQRLENYRSTILKGLRSSVRSEDFIWSLAGDKLQGGLNQLKDLADRRIIPGLSVEVLVDRLAIDECVCGESLNQAEPEGKNRRNHIESLIQQQRDESAVSQRMTAIWHVARTAKAGYEARIEQSQGFWHQRERLLRELVETKEDIVAKNTRLSTAKAARSKIDDERVRDLTERVSRVEKEISLRDRELGETAERIRLAIDVKQKRKEEVDKALKTRGRHSSVTTHKEVADDLQRLAQGTLETLQQDYVQRVGDRTSELFMKIVGSDPAFNAGVFTGIRIAENTFNIVVKTHGGKHLDPSFELNGASQRALTLAFIWALTEVSGTTAPRIIDTPLGMVAGGVKTRMVNVITAPSVEDAPDFQVVLLLTRSEVRDIEALLDERAGIVSTMSCSKDYPEDLRFAWDADKPVVRTCLCDHRHSCRRCARKYDDQHGVSFIDTVNDQIGGSYNG